MLLCAVMARTLKNPVRKLLIMPSEQSLNGIQQTHVKPQGENQVVI